MTWAGARIGLGVLLAGAVACGGDGGTDPTPPPKPVATVTVTPASLTLAPGESGNLTADLRAADGTALSGRPVTWASADPAVASVSAQGAVSALTVGSTTVTATAEGKTGSAQVVVAHPPATTVVVLPATLSIQAGQTGQFTAEARNPAGNAIPGKTFTWAVGNPLVATISQAGQVSALIPGTTTVTASVDGKIGSATLTVVPGPVATVEVAPAASTVEVTKTVQLVATAKDASGFVVPDQPVAWVSSAPSIASVSNSGLVTGVVPGGPVTVTATVAGKTGTASITVVPGPVASVTVTPGASTLEIGQTVQLAAAARDAQGNPITGRPATWTSAVPATASVSTTGLVTAIVAGGPVTITATIDGVPGTAAITVVPVPVAMVEVTPPSATVFVNGTVQLAATARAANGSVLTGRAVQWVSANPAVAAVSPTGLVTGVASGGPVTVTATIEGRSAGAAITVGTAFTALSAGAAHTCGRTSAGVGYCWGSDGYGQLGDGATSQGSLFPVAVQGGLVFTALSAGLSHTCGRTSAGVGYCWGSNGNGQLGDGTTLAGASPVPVAGGLVFTALTAGNFNHTCGVTSAGVGYCWGANVFGQLGDGTTVDRASPVPVAGGPVFTALSAGGYHTCGRTSAGAAYCWGSNVFGQLGNGQTGQESLFPVAVQGGLVFTALSLGDGHSCGLTSAGEGYCWGNNGNGQLGDGTTVARASPVPVAGGLVFSALTAWGYHTCGLTNVGLAYCWGGNDYGQAGDGTTTDRASPVRVAGGLVFTALTAGYGHTCGVTSTGAAFCWGRNTFGQLGDGTTTDRLLPVAVILP